MKNEFIPIKSFENNFDFKGFEFENNLNDLVKQHIQNIQNKRNDLIVNRLNEFGIVFNLEEEKKRRFKRLCIEHKGNEETIYYNDGSINGLKIITFKTIMEDIDPLKMSVNINTYYH